MIAALRFALVLLLATTAAVHAQEDTARFGTGPTVLTLRSTTDITILAPAIEQFVAANPDLTVAYEQWGSNDLFAISRKDCETGRPGADAVFSSGVHQLVWLVNAACAAPHQSPQTAALPPARRWRNELWGVTEEPAVIIYNTRQLSAEDVPRDRFALLDLMRQNPPELRRRIATYDIGASGLGYLFAYSDSLEATTFGALLEGFSRMEAVATCCSAEIIDGVSDGRYLIAYNVLGSYVESDLDPEVGIILPEDYTLILSRAYMIARTATQPEAAGRLLDFLLSTEGRAALTRVGLVKSWEASETGLLPSARRQIALSPTLLVALDQNRREKLFDLWDKAFAIDARP